VRRYSDFAWLCQELSKEFPGIIVPPLPDKLTVGRFGEDFVESRKRGLEKFLQRVAAHAELSNSQYFIVFLQSAESGLNEAKNESKSKATKSSGSSISWLDSTVNKVTTGSKVVGASFLCNPSSCTYANSIVLNFPIARAGEVCGGY
jgi:sorting nexin-1/2